LLRRLSHEEKIWLDRLATLEGRIRQFEDFEHPAYQAWIRLQLGPQFTVLEEVYQSIYERRILIQKVQRWVESGKMSPREALYTAMAKKSEDIPPENDPSDGASHSSSGPSYSSKGKWSSEEIEARRQAKREAKREARRQAKNEEQAKKQNTDIERHEKLDEQRQKIVKLYRGLARKLHPDSPISIQGVSASRMRSLWLEVQSAYHAGNIERLFALSTWLGANSGHEDVGLMDVPALSLSQRFERIRVLEKSCVRLEKKVHQLCSHPAWEFNCTSSSSRLSLRRKLRKRAERELNDEISQAQQILGELEDFIDSIGRRRR
jgi:hypothetical protein